MPWKDLARRGTRIQERISRTGRKVPEAYLEASSVKLAPWSSAIYDFRYLKCPDLHEERVRSNETARTIDDSFRDKYLDVVEECFDAFQEASKYVEDVMHAFGKREVSERRANGTGSCRRRVVLILTRNES